jgi:hypothetical protein
MSTIPRSSRRFTIFPELPTELKLKIWEFALLAPRVISVKDNYTRQPHLLRAMGRQPGIIHANRQAWEVALNSILVLKDRFHHLIYFNLDYDIFFFIAEVLVDKFLNWH